MKVQINDKVFYLPSVPNRKPERTTTAITLDVPEELNDSFLKAFVEEYYNEIILTLEEDDDYYKDYELTNYSVMFLFLDDCARIKRLTVCIEGDYR